MTPAEAIERHGERLAKMDDRSMLEALKQLDPLPDADDDDPAWNDDETFDRAHQLVAFADEIGRRRLVAAVAELYERAALGDAFEMMESIRHGAEMAVASEWSVLVDIMRGLSKAERSGTRRWPVEELGVLSDPTSLPELVTASEDEEPLVRHEALWGLRKLARAPDSNVRSVVVARLLNSARTDPSLEIRYAAGEILAELDPDAAQPYRRPPPPEPFSDPDWTGDASGREGAEVTRRIVRSLITGALQHPSLNAYLTTTGRELVMTPGSGVYPPREPGWSEGDAPPAWRAEVVLWTAAAGDRGREPSSLVAEIDLRRASKQEVRARLVGVAPRDTGRR